MVEEAERLIRFNTVTWSSNLDCAVYLGSLFRRFGLDVIYQENRVGELIFMNVAAVAGAGKQPLLMTTHLDTVDAGDPALWTKTGRDPWKMTRHGNTLYGLGVADTKLDILCKLAALVDLPTDRFTRQIFLLGTFGEESGLRGAARFCQGDLPKPKMALVGEPTELHLVTRHKGLAVAEILFKTKGLHRPSAAEWVYEAVFTGKPAHSSTPHLGVNALDLSAAFLRKLKARFSKIAVLSWQGGSGHNVIPASASVRFSLGPHPKVFFPSAKGCQVKAQRLNPGWYPRFPWEDMMWVMDEVRTVFLPLEKFKDSSFDPPRMTWNFTWLRETREGWSLTFDARPLAGRPVHKAVRVIEQKLTQRLGHPGPDWQFCLERDNPPLETDPKSEVAKAVLSALKSVRLNTRPRCKSGCTEAGLYSKVGIPSVVIGPGTAQGNIHQPNESVSIKQLKDAIRFYKRFLEKTCM